MKVITQFFSQKRHILITFATLIIAAYTLVTHSKNTYPGYLLILPIAFAVPLFSESFRKFLAETIDSKILALLFLGFFLRLHFSLFNFVHLNYHGPVYIHAITSLWGFEVIPYGFTYNVLWHPLAKFFTFTHQMLFWCNLILSLVTGFLLYALSNAWFKDKWIALLISAFFILSPLQIAMAATESHFILYSFFLIYLLILSEFKNDSVIELTLPFVLALATFIRPTTIIIFPVFMFYICTIDYLCGRKFNPGHLLKLTIFYALLTMIPLWDFLRGYYNVFFVLKIPLSSNEPGHSLNLFKQHYYIILYPIMVLSGLGSAFQKSITKSRLIALLPLIFIVLFESVAKNSFWHISIYYQTSIEIFYFLLIGFLIYYAVQSKPKLKPLILSLSALLIIAQLYTKMDVYNKKYDEQIEQEFVWKNLDIVKPDDVVYQTYIRVKNSELFNPFYFSPDQNIRFLIRSKDELTSSDFEAKEPGNKLFYRSLSIPSEEFENIKRKRGLVPLRTTSFEFEKRFSSHISNGENITVGFYRITK